MAFGINSLGPGWKMPPQDLAHLRNTGKPVFSLLTENVLKKFFLNPDFPCPVLFFNLSTFPWDGTDILISFHLASATVAPKEI